MKHFKVCQKYYSARHIFNSLLSVSSGDEAQCQMLNIIFTRISLSRQTPLGSLKKCQRKEMAAYRKSKSIEFKQAFVKAVINRTVAH